AEWLDDVPDGRDDRRGTWRSCVAGSSFYLYGGRHQRDRVALCGHGAASAAGLTRSGGSLVGAGALHLTFIIIFRKSFMARLPYADLTHPEVSPLVEQIVAERGSVLHFYQMLLQSPPVAR